MNTSLKVRAIRIASQKKAATMTRRVKPGLYLTCMKKRITRVALHTAMASAATVFMGPKSLNATAVVTAVSAMSAANTRK